MNKHLALRNVRRRRRLPVLDETPPLGMWTIRHMKPIVGARQSDEMIRNLLAEAIEDYPIR